MNKNYKIYLDIDGVLLKKDGAIPDFGEDFISFITENYPCFWLTTHCRGGENKSVQYLSGYYPSEIRAKLEIVQPAYWDDLKTEAIDFTSDFFWLDDDPFESEKQILHSYNRHDRLILVNLEKKDELKKVLDKIKKVLK